MVTKESENNPAATLTLADQVSKLYELVAGYRATHLLEIARELGVCETFTESSFTESFPLAPSTHLPLEHCGPSGLLRSRRSRTSQACQASECGSLRRGWQ